MKLLMDLSTFGKEHKGGKDEVAYNLLRAFSILGLTDRVLCAASPELTEIIHAIDPHYQVIPLHRPKSTARILNLLSSVSDIIYGLKIRRITREHGCDRILFTNKLSPLIRQKVKTYLLPHDIQFFRVLESSGKLKLYTRVYVVLVRINFRVCDRIIAISDFDRNEMTRFLPQYGEKIIQIYDPILFKSVRPDADRCYITAVNIQHEHKNTLTLVRAYARLAPEISEKLILVGRKEFRREDEEEINRIIRERKLSDRIIFTGFVSEEELKRIISKTRVFVNPSLYEGFGMAAVEMMESEVPTIVSKTTAQPESTLGLCRYYEPATDDETLANTIREELRNPTPPQELKEIAQKIREKYDYRVIAREYWSEIMGSD